MNLRPGEIVDIIIRNAEVGFANTPDGHTLFRVGERGVIEDNRDIVSLNVDKPGVEIERLVPDAGEPVVGDVWRDARGAIYFAGIRDRGIVFYDAVAHGSRICQRWADVHRGPRGPITLDYRPPSNLPHSAEVEPAEAASDPSGDDAKSAFFRTLE